MSTDHDPITDAELDLLDTIDPTRLCASGVTVSVAAGPFAMGKIIAMCSTTADARAIAAALNALPALLAEVRASRERERIRETWAAASDDAPRLHIPADLLTRPAGGGVR